jgi:hypothetical protein
MYRHVKTKGRRGTEGLVFTFFTYSCPVVSDFAMSEMPLRVVQAEQLAGMELMEPTLPEQMSLG